MQTREFQEDGVHILALAGEIDLASSPELRALLHAHAQARRSALLIDFGGVSYVDSSGLATLVEYVRKVQHFGGRLALAAVTERVRTIFDLVRLSEIFPIYPTLADAKAALAVSPGA
ncbi:MAG: anti-sigma factor antagonist [Chthoniobacter sp.]|jgi:anti-sigma B factor antagonist|nr:anti-sigma factor antagonist [Chthoniobacter sp.]